MKAKTMRPAAKRTAAVLMAALLAIAGLVGPLMARAERALAAETSIYVSDEHLDFRQYDSNTGNSWADTFMYIDGEVVITGAEAAEKSYPAFFDDYNMLGGKANVIILE